MNTLFYLVRHGTSTDSGKGIIRGDRNSKLDRQGFMDAHDLKNFFKLKEWDHIFTSNMTRSIQTGTIIGEPRDKLPSKILEDLRPWDVGYLTGKDKKQYAPDMMVFVENPEMRPKGGETRNEFFNRVDPLFVAFAELALKTGKPNIVIGHSSVIHALAHLLWGDGHPPLAVKPGGVIEVFVNKDGEVDAKEILKPGKDDSSFAGGQQPTS